MPRTNNLWVILPNWRGIFSAAALRDPSDRPGIWKYMLTILAAAGFSFRTDLAIQEAEKWPACLESLGYNIFLKLFHHWESEWGDEADPLTWGSPRAAARWDRSECRGWWPSPSRTRSAPRAPRSSSSGWSGQDGGWCVGDWAAVTWMLMGFICAMLYTCVKTGGWRSHRPASPTRPSDISCSTPCHSSETQRRSDLERVSSQYSAVDLSHPPARCRPPRCQCRCEGQSLWAWRAARCPPCWWRVCPGPPSLQRTASPPGRRPWRSWEWSWAGPGADTDQGWTCPCYSLHPRSSQQSRYHCWIISFHLDCLDF